jgi:hypothetical protein
MEKQAWEIKTYYGIHIQVLDTKKTTVLCGAEAQAEQQCDLCTPASCLYCTTDQVSLTNKTQRRHIHRADNKVHPIAKYAISS